MNIQAFIRVIVNAIALSKQYEQYIYGSHAAVSDNTICNETRYIHHINIIVFTNVTAAPLKGRA